MLKIVTVDEILNTLTSHPIKGAKIAGLLTRTTPAMNVKDRITKEPNPFLPEGVERLAYRSVILGASYENAVNRERQAEATAAGETEAEYFNPQALWNGAGERHGPYTVIHKVSGRIYFAVKPSQVKVERNVADSGRIAVVHEDLWRSVRTGEVLDVAALANYLPLPSKSKTQDVDHDILWRTIALDSVVQVVWGGNTYQIAA